MYLWKASGEKGEEEGNRRRERETVKEGKRCGKVKGVEVTGMVARERLMVGKLEE